MKRNYEVPEITVTGVPGEEAEPINWLEAAEQQEEFERKARQKDRRRKARRAKVKFSVVSVRDGV